jgi:predicted dinucleotide-binding enzyme
MKIGVIGAGNIGATLARMLAASSHEVKLANQTQSTLGDLKTLVEMMSPVEMHDEICQAHKKAAPGSTERLGGSASRPNASIAGFPTTKS